MNVVLNWIHGSESEKNRGHIMSAFWHTRSSLCYIHRSCTTAKILPLPTYPSVQDLKKYYRTAEREYVCYDTVARLIDFLLEIKISSMISCHYNILSPCSNMHHLVIQKLKYDITTTFLHAAWQM